MVLIKDVVSDITDEKRLAEAFKVFDGDNNGYIDVDELGKMRNHIWYLKTLKSTLRRCYEQDGSESECQSNKG